MSDPHTDWMRLAMQEGDLARGSTGDNPWVGCVIVGADGTLLGRGHTQGPGEDHAEIAAARDAQARGHSVEGATLYSTLEPCSFHGRTPSCARSIAQRRVACVVTGMRDPHPKVDGVGVRMLRDAGVEVFEGICEDAVRRQLGPWVLQHHPHDVLRRAGAYPMAQRVEAVVRLYGVDEATVQAWIASDPTGARRAALRGDGA